MKTLNNYILEKLIIDKNTKKTLLNNTFCLVVPFGSAYDDIVNDYEDARITNNDGDPDAFILPIDTVKNYYDIYSKEEVTIYRIPDNYKEISEFEDAYENGEISTEDMGKIEAKELNEKS